MFKLYVDPGHGGTDSGAIGNELQEKDLTLDIALRIRTLLLNNYENVDVKMSRETDVFVSLTERTNAANDWQADYFLSIHINSADSSSANGYEDYIYIGLSDSSQTAMIQNIIHEEVMKTNELLDRGKKKADFHVLRESNMEALLTENGFITNVDDAAKLKDENWRQKVAEGHVNGLASAFNLTKKSNIFRVIVDDVQVGAYAKKENIVAAVQNHLDQSKKILIQKVPAQLVVTPPAPLSSLSRFMSTVNTGTLYAEGEQLGAMAASATRDDIVVLDFGWPKYNKNTKAYGTLLFTGFGAGNTFASTTEIASAVKAFVQGYHDQIILNNNVSGSKVVIAIGTNNKKGASSNHAQAWASMVDQVNSWVQSQNYIEITIASASDMEMGWNSARNTRKWVDGYKSYYLNNNRPSITLYNYGDAAGCPPYGNCNNGWTQEDVWYISWGSGISSPLPEIYTTNSSQAKEWANLVKYSFTKDPNNPMIIAGVMTQYQACQDQGGCSGTNNTPEQGWTQLWNELNADSQTAQTLLNPQTLRWVTDITWQN
ncbi:N-acetylmuramoyl-L-alanine amidase [Bacillus cereus]|uniref:N-acetylmuramoyl-L-alanine amidase n=1 Tax=Bacillus cereus TaxID=1396 RepID=A0A9X7CB82_BACCE|nr:hypothetical protein BK708_02575 [Bacillus thuringiensis serovar yunnanensis]PGO75370.1 N-acetylmuramoyl-L-alanine amidase [Bacillus cereus]